LRRTVVPVIGLRLREVAPSPRVARRLEEPPRSAARWGACSSRRRGTAGEPERGRADGNGDEEGIGWRLPRAAPTMVVKRGPAGRSTAPRRASTTPCAAARSDPCTWAPSRVALGVFVAIRRSGGRAPTASNRFLPTAWSGGEAARRSSRTCPARSDRPAPGVRRADRGASPRSCMVRRKAQGPATEGGSRLGGQAGERSHREARGARDRRRSAARWRDFSFPATIPRTGQGTRWDEHPSNKAVRGGRSPRGWPFLTLGHEPAVVSGLPIGPPG
jgi:hypothetical protein